MLGSYINGHPNCRMLIEPINPPGHRHHMQPVPDDQGLIPRKLVHQNLPLVLDWIFSKEGLPSFCGFGAKKASLVAGFKIMAHQIKVLRDPSVFWAECARRNVTAVTLHRHNVLKQIVSDFITLKTRIPVNYGGKHRVVRVNMPPSLISPMVKAITEDRNYLDKMIAKYNLRHKLVIYEDLCSDENKMCELFKWISGNDANLTTKTIKQNSDCLRDLLSNYDEFTAECRRLHLNAFLKDT